MNIQSCRLVLLFAGLLSLPLQAQTMYRCGSSYQDRPCDNGQPGKIIGVNRAPTDADKPKLDLACSRRGEEAKKIIWQREGGAIQEKLLAEAGNAERRKLIADVYAMRANSSEVRAAIESDCMAEKNRERAYPYAQSEADPGAFPSAQRSLPAAAGSAAQADKQAENAARKRALCEQLKQQLAANRKSQRSGGSVESMESLNQQRRDSATELKAIGCQDAQGSMEMR